MVQWTDDIFIVNKKNVRITYGGLVTLRVN